MHAPALPPRTPSRRQRGVASLLFIVLLVAGVLLVLSQSTDLIRNRSSATVQDMDSTAALMLAESGLQRAEAMITRASATMTAADCGAVATGSPFAMGRGSISYPSTAATPPSCSYQGSPCVSCTISATGTVGAVEKTLGMTVAFGVVYGTTGRGQTVTMVLRNDDAQPSIALFALGWRRQDAGGNAKSAVTVCSGDCTLRWNLESSSGQPSVGSMATTLSIVGNGANTPVVQSISLARDYAEVGALFRGKGGVTPVVIGSYWADNGSQATSTNQVNGTTGATNSGVAGGGTCLAGGTVPNPPGVTTAQSCNDWCRGAGGIGEVDTIAFGVSARSDSLNDQVTAVTFNSVPFTSIVRFPNVQAQPVANASGKVFSEVWWKYNEPFTSTFALSGVTAGMTSYPGAMVARAGAVLTIPALSANNQDTGTVTAFSGVQACVGDPVDSARLPSGTTIDKIDGTNTPGTCRTASGFGIKLTQKTSGGGGGTTFTVRDAKLVPQATTGTVVAGAVSLPGGSTSSVTGPDGAGNFTLAQPAYIAGDYVTQGSSGSTIRVPSGTDLPAVGTVLAVWEGTGLLPANTTVTGTATNAFTLSAAPSTPLVGAKACGGTCGLFNLPASTASSTPFTVAKTGSTLQWAGGFACLKGVDKTKTVAVTSRTITGRNWAETIQ